MQCSPPPLNCYNTAGAGIGVEILFYFYRQRMKVRQVLIYPSFILLDNALSFTFIMTNVLRNYYENY